MRRIASRRLKVVLSAILLTACTSAGVRIYRATWMSPAQTASMPTAVPSAHLTAFQRAVIGDLDRQVAANIRYQDGYFQGGDPPPNIGVCTDVVIRSYRAAGVNLQALVARDVRANPGAYGIAKPDPNIDHRRCRNLAIFFKRYAISLPTSGPNADWQPGDIVLWDTNNSGNANHIGVIANHLDAAGVPTVVHHLPGLTVREMDWLYAIPVVDHFRWPAAERHSADVTA
jgi:uncharacterized protein